MKFEHVTKVYSGGRPAVNDLSLEVRTGELLVMIGPSGCGKTTTLRMINRLEEPTSGTISIDGRNIRSYDPILLRRGIGYTIQQTGLLPHMTVEQNIELVPRLLKWDKARRNKRTRELLTMVGMDYEMFAHRYPRQLSGGQQQRVGVLRSLATDPPIILMDEPFGALDPISREVLQSELKRLQEHLHKTIIFVTHDIDEALRLGDRIAIFREGNLHQVDTPEALLHAPKDEFVEKFLGRFLSLHTYGLASVRQLMQGGPMQILQEAPDGARIVQVANTPLWLKIDDAGILQGVADPLSGVADLWNALRWRDGVSACVKDEEAPNEVLNRLTVEDVEALPVVDAEHHLLGVVTHRSAIKALSARGGEG
ncbi:MAG TPA: betaine/proline/choline family ABC transporter ATP-binding protein [Ktedonobacteraceae bacterium]